MSIEMGNRKRKTCSGEGNTNECLCGSQLVDVDSVEVICCHKCGRVCQSCCSIPKYSKSSAMLDDDFDSENNNPWYCPICCDTIYWDEAKEEIKEYIRNHSDVIDGDAMIPIQSHTLAAKCRSGTKGYYKRKRANGNYYFQVQVKLTHNKKENYIFSRNYDFEHHAKIAFALVTHKEYDLFHDEYLQMVMHVDTILGRSPSMN